MQMYFTSYLYFMTILLWFLSRYCRFSYLHTQFAVSALTSCLLQNQYTNIFIYLKSSYSSTWCWGFFFSSAGFIILRVFLLKFEHFFHRCPVNEWKQPSSSSDSSGVLLFLLNEAETDRLSVFCSVFGLYQPPRGTTVSLGYTQGGSLNKPLEDNSSSCWVFGCNVWRAEHH